MRCSRLRVDVEEECEMARRGQHQQQQQHYPSNDLPTSFSLHSPMQRCALLLYNVDEIEAASQSSSACAHEEVT